MKKLILLKSFLIFSSMAFFKETHSMKRKLTVQEKNEIILNSFGFFSVLPPEIFNKCLDDFLYVCEQDKKAALFDFFRLSYVNKYWQCIVDTNKEIIITRLGLADIHFKTMQDNVLGIAYLKICLKEQLYKKDRDNSTIETYAGKNVKKLLDIRSMKSGNEEDLAFILQAKKEFCEKGTLTEDEYKNLAIFYGKDGRKILQEELINDFVYTMHLENNIHRLFNEEFLIPEKVFDDIAERDGNLLAYDNNKETFFEKACGRDSENKHIIEKLLLYEEVRNHLIKGTNAFHAITFSLQFNTYYGFKNLCSIDTFKLETAYPELPFHLIMDIITKNFKINYKTVDQEATKYNKKINWNSSYLNKKTPLIFALTHEPLLKEPLLQKDCISWLIKKKKVGLLPDLDGKSPEYYVRDQQPLLILLKEAN